MSRLTRFARTVTWSTMLAASALGMVGGIGCAEETFQCCECKFQTCQAPDPANPGSFLPAPQTVCACNQEFTYESCGTYCYEQAPKDLLALEMSGALAMCGSADANGNYVITPQTGTVLAKDSCNAGSPVGE